MAADVTGCDVCGGDHNTEDCPELGLGEETKNTHSRAYLTLPHFAQLVTFENESFGITVRDKLPARSKLGPFEAKKFAENFDVENGFLLKLFPRDGTDTVVCLDTTSEFHWMCYIRTATSPSEQNCMAVQIGYEIYYTITRDVLPGQELMVWYAPHYARKLGKSTEPDPHTQVLLGIDLPFTLMENRNKSVAGSSATDTSGMDASRQFTFDCGQCGLHFDSIVKLQHHSQQHRVEATSDKFINAVCSSIADDNNLSDLHMQKETTCGMQSESETEGKIAELKDNKSDIRETVQSMADNSFQSSVKLTESDYREKNRVVKVNTSSKTQEKGMIGCQTKDLCSGMFNDNGETKMCVNRAGFMSNVINTCSQMDDPVEFKPEPSTSDKSLPVKSCPISQVDLAVSGFTDLYVAVPDLEKKMADYASVEKSVRVSTSSGIMSVSSSCKSGDPVPNDDQKRSNDIQFLIRADEEFSENNNIDFYTIEGTPSKARHPLQARTIYPSGDTLFIKEPAGSMENEMHITEELLSGEDEKVVLVNADNTGVQRVNSIWQDKLALTKYVAQYLATHGGEMRCTPCDRKYARKESFLYHMKKCHPEELNDLTVFACNKCYKAYVGQASFDKHMVVHTGTFSCDKCERRFATEERQLNHNCPVDDTELARLYCTPCGARFSDLKDYERHVASHKDNVSCATCKLTFPSRVMLRYHMKQSHSDSSLSEGNRRKRVRSGKPLPVSPKRKSRQHLKTGRSIPDLKVKMSKTTTSTESQSTVKIKIEGGTSDVLISTSGVFLDSDCKESKSDSEELGCYTAEADSFQMQQMELEKPLSTNGDDGNITEELLDKGVILSNEKEVIEQSLVESGTRSGRQIQTENPSQSKVSNEPASSMFLPKGHLECTECHRSYLRKESYFYHMKKCHPEKLKEPVFTCNKCYIAFFSAESIKKHMKKHHINCALCVNCNHLFSSEENRSDHECPLNSDSVIESNEKEAVTFQQPLVDSVTGSVRQVKTENPPQSKGEEKVSNEQASCMLLPKGKLECTECHRSYLRKESYFYHMKKCHPEKLKEPVFTCDKCYKAFFRAESIENHMMKHHIDSARCAKCNHLFSFRENGLDHVCPLNADDCSNLSCSPCGAKFKNKRHYKRHMASHEQRVSCQKCNRKFFIKKGSVNQSSDLCQRCFKAGESKQFVCEMCGKVFKQNHVLNIHLKTCLQVRDHYEAIQTYPCWLCNEVFDKTALLQDHLNLHTSSDNDINSLEDFKCIFCHETFADVTQFRHHYQEHKPPFNCGDCGQQFMMKYYFEFHDCDTDLSESVKCEICHKVFRSSVQLKCHRVVYDEIRYTCQRCRQVSHSIKLYNDHMCVSDDGQIKRIKRRDGREYFSSETSHICSICGKVLSCFGNLRKHMAYHKERKHKCTVCGKMFHLREGLTRHLKIHTDKGPCQCPLCGKQSKNSNALRDHMRIIHRPDGDRFQCHTCGKRFRQKVNMNKHMLHHIPGKLFHCNICDTGFRVKQRLQRHMLWHKQGTQYKCQQCPREFVLEADLRWHVKNLHSNIAYQCPFCIVVCSWIHTLRKHLRQKHPKKDWNDHPDFFSRLVCKRTKIKTKTARTIVSQRQVAQPVVAESIEVVNDAGVDEEIDSPIPTDGGIDVRQKTITIKVGGVDKEIICRPEDISALQNIVTEEVVTSENLIIIVPKEKQLSQQ